MPAEVETMFSARVKPWHGIGTVVEECPNSGEAMKWYNKVVTPNRK